ncbi:hypothetical protein [Sorangium sp. So ce131]|uniref:hypothetical protein n=1 Tax=Sorangium sp. So ce131 TaxID=3133282 RepID=UPI003F5DF143
MIGQEARALLTRLDRLRSFALQETMVPAAAFSVEAQAAIESYLVVRRRELRTRIHDYLAWLDGAEGRAAPPAYAQKRFVLIRLLFNALLSQFDIFSEAMSQRSEVNNGVWLSGLDVVSQDALALPGYYQAPPVICYLARGPGAAIRRARTRLPGGGNNPVSIIRIPRERMIGSGIASSLVHEVGHQAAALLNLVPSLRSALGGVDAGRDVEAWSLWERWISEIVADLWSISRLGVTSTLGLIAVMSLPRPFVFRVTPSDPHPMPWIRVKLSSAIGQALYPHPQWARVSRLWEELYPLTGVSSDTRRLAQLLEASLPRFVDFLVTHRPDRLRGRSLAEALAARERQPAQLKALYGELRAHRARLRKARPSLVFAVLGQARADGRITPEEESEALDELLKYWALRSTLDTSEICASLARARSSPTGLVAPALPGERNT